MAFSYINKGVYKMKKSNLWLAIPAIALVFGVMVVGCGEGGGKDNWATIDVKNTSNILYSVSTSTIKNPNEHGLWTRVKAGEKAHFSFFWNDDDVASSSIVITIFYQASDADYYNTRTYYLSNREERYVEIP
jgi:uncharacterized lipoprotein YehR (DUF1307 family)